MARQKQDDEQTQAPDLASATLEGFRAIADELRAEREARSKHDEQVITRLGKYKENPAGSPKRSKFNLRGQRDFPLPALKCRVFAPHPLNRDPEISGMTREEIELVNLLEPGKYHVSLLDGSRSTMTITVVKNEATQELEDMRVESPAFSKEGFRQMPAMSAWLREVLDQHAGDIPERAEAVLTMKREKLLIAKGEIAVAV